MVEGLIMKTLKTVVSSTLLTLMALAIQAPAALHASANSDSIVEIGVVQVMVQDEQGAPVAHAPIYIYDAGLAKVLESGPQGSISIDLKKGKYTISSAQSSPKQGWVDRYASAPAHVQVISEDMTSVILTLRPVQDPISELSISTLQKIGVADQVAKYTN
jgi:hypothetical protein